MSQHDQITISPEADMLIRRIELHARQGQFHAARELLNTLEQIGLKGKRPSINLETPLSEVLNTRAANIIESRFGATTITDLLKIPKFKLLRANGIGPDTVQAISARLAAAGITWSVR